MTPPPSAWCDRQKLAEWFMDSAPDVDLERGLQLADDLLASGCIEKKPSVEEVVKLIPGLFTRRNGKLPDKFDIARAVLGVKAPTKEIARDE